MEMFDLSIVTPEKVFFEAKVKSIIIPGTEGYMGVLPHHAPLITALQPGRIEFKDAEDKTHIMAVSGGFLEVSRNHVNLLVEAVEFADDIDLDRAELAFKTAKEKLGATDAEVDVQAEEAALARAANRIKVYRETHK